MTEQENPGAGIRTTPVDRDTTRAALLGCGGGCLVLGTLLAIFLAVLGLRMVELSQWWLDVSEQYLAQQAPEDWSSGDAAALESAFAGAREHFASKDVSPERLQALSREITRCLQRAMQGLLTRDDLQALRLRLEAFVGRASAPRAPDEGAGDSALEEVA